MTTRPQPRRQAPAALAGVVATAVVLAVALGACGSTAAPSLTGTPPVSASASAGVPANLVSPVVGEVIRVDSPSLGKVTGFTMLVAGQPVQFTMGVLDDPTAFPAPHLSEHVGGDPVEVYFRLQGDALVVYRLADAPSASPSAS